MNNINEVAEIQDRVVVLAIPCSGSTLEEMVQDFISYVQNEDAKNLVFNVLYGVDSEVLHSQLLEQESEAFEFPDSVWAEDAIQVVENY